MKNFKKYILAVTLTLISVFFLTNFQPAQANSFSEGLNDTAGKAGYENNTIFPKNDIAKSISFIITVILSIVGMIFLGLMIYGGFIWMNAKGNETETKKAMDIIRNAVIGIIVVFAAYVITNITIVLFQNTAENPAESELDQYIPA